MIAFVLSGGGARGALEVGALQALVEANIRADMIVGTSAGAINAAGFATNPTTAGVERLAGQWIHAPSGDIFPGNWFTIARRFLTRQDSLYPNDGLRRFIEACLPPGVNTFGDITQIRLYTTAANLNSSSLFLFGEDPKARLVDAVLASSAIPPIFPPVEHNGYQYVDGGVVANVPIAVAVGQGATTVYAINLGDSGEMSDPARGIIPIAQQTIFTLMYQQLLDDLADVAQMPHITLYNIVIAAFQGHPIRDLSQSAAMIAEGYRATREYLSRPPITPVLPLGPPRAPAPPPPGARIWRLKR